METRGYRILLVDDQEADYQLIHAMLLSSQAKDCELVWIRSYELAILSIQVDHWDAVLVNQRVREHSGLEFIHHALLWKDNLPMILLSDVDDPTLDYKARKIGAYDCVAKGMLNQAYFNELLVQRQHGALSLPNYPGGQISQVLGRLLF